LTISLAFLATSVATFFAFLAPFPAVLLTAFLVTVFVALLLAAGFLPPFLVGFLGAGFWGTGFLEGSI